MTPDAIRKAWPGASFAVIAAPGLGSVRDQGPRGTCLAMATTAAHVAAQQVGHWLSEEFLFHSARQVDGLAPATDGTTASAILKALASPGQPDETQWPYDPTSSTPPRQAGQAPVCAGPFFTWRAKRIDSSIAGIEGSLTATHPVVVVLRLSFGFSRPVNGFVRVAVADPERQAQHAVLVVGLATSTSGGGDFFLVRNSWGTSWGVNGYALVQKEYLRDRLKSTIVLS